MEKYESFNTFIRNKYNTMVINSDYIYTRTKASGVINISGFITFRIFGFEGICMAGVFGFYPFTLHR